MEKVPAMRENESLLTLRGRWTSWGNQPIEWAIEPRFWKDWWGLMDDRHVWFLLHSLIQLIDIQTRMFPAPIPPLCKGKCRCSRKWGGEKGAGNGTCMSTPTLKCSLAWEEGHSLEVYPGLHLSRIWGRAYCQRNHVCSMHVFLVLLYKAPI